MNKAKHDTLNAPFKGDDIELEDFLSKVVSTQYNFSHRELKRNLKMKRILPGRGKRKKLRRPIFSKRNSKMWNWGVMRAVMIHHRSRNLRRRRVEAIRRCGLRTCAREIGECCRRLWLGFSSFMACFWLGAFSSTILTLTNFTTLVPAMSIVLERNGLSWLTNKLTSSSNWR